jgi:hypothetical protein
MNPTGMMAAAARAYMAQKNAQNPNPSPEGQAQVLGADQEEPTTYGRLKKDWNDFYAWMKTQQLDGKPAAGNPLLDTTRKGAKETIGQELFHRYIKENPQTTLSDEMMPLIRQGLLQTRDFSIRSMKEGRMGGYAGMDDVIKRGDDPQEYFMRALLLNEQSPNPNLVGQNLSQYMFPTNIDASGKPIVPVEQYGGDFEIAKWKEAKDKSKFLGDVYNDFFTKHFTSRLPQEMASKAQELYGSWLPSAELSQRMKNKPKPANP